MSATNGFGPPRIRLSIAHLMLWTAGSAVILACFRATSRGQEELPSEVLRLQPFYHLGYSLTLGAQFGSVLLFAVRRIRRQGGFPAQPGHWLLLIEGFSAILMLSGYGIYRLLEEAGQRHFHLYFAFQLPNLAACSVGYVVAFTRTLPGSPWRFALGLSGLVHFIQFVLFAISAWTMFVSMNRGSWLGIWEPPQHCIGFVLALAVLLASLGDWRKHADRDFLHWAGIATFLGNIALHLIYRMLLVSL